MEQIILLGRVHACYLFKLEDYKAISTRRTNPAEPNPGKWEFENSLIMSWLIDSMQPQLARGYLLLDTAQKIWDAAAQTYSQSGNDAQIYELRKKVHETKQGEMTVAQYFSELTGLWQELDYYQDSQASCASDATKFQKSIEKQRVYDFLEGLNDVLDQIRIQVLGRNPFPFLRKAYSFVQQEESRRGVMMPIILTERSSKLVNSYSVTAKHNATGNTGRGGDEQDERSCEYCGKPRHTKDTCWRLHGRPKRGRGGRRYGDARPQAHISETFFYRATKGTQFFCGLSNEELQTLKASYDKT